MHTHPHTHTTSSVIVRRRSQSLLTDCNNELNLCQHRQVRVLVRVGFFFCFFVLNVSLGTC